MTRPVICSQCNRTGENVERLRVDTIAHEVRAVLHQQFPNLHGDNLIVVLARVSAWEHRRVGHREPDPEPLSPSEFRARTAAIELGEDPTAQELEDEVDALVDALDAAANWLEHRCLTDPRCVALHGTPPSGLRNEPEWHVHLSGIGAIAWSGTLRDSLRTAMAESPVSPH